MYSLYNLLLSICALQKALETQGKQEKSHTWIVMELTSQEKDNKHDVISRLER